VATLQTVDFTKNKQHADKLKEKPCVNNREETIWDRILRRLAIVFIGPDNWFVTDRGHGCLKTKGNTTGWRTPQGFSAYGGNLAIFSEDTSLEI
jgi:hypothetical protein